MKCSILVEPTRPERFFMDMRVYRIERPIVRVIQEGTGSLIWRGIYLAVAAGSPGQGENTF